jgi:hypothetical protein
MCTPIVGLIASVKNPETVSLGTNYIVEIVKGDHTKANPANIVNRR